MDTEESRKIQQKIMDGRPETDEGPYYHDSWWESYKGSIKGKFGGAIIGALIGAAIGGATVGILLLAHVALGATALAVVGGFAAAGLFYGQEEFSNVGTVTGAVSAAHEKSEERMKSFEKSKFAEIKQEISELKAMISGATGAKVIKHTPLDTNDDSPLDYRTSHRDEHTQSPYGKLIFWKVAAIGLAVGAVLGAVIAASPVIAAPIMTGLALSHAGLIAASMATFGLFGASFGINRDTFRHVFDHTDLLFKGITRAPKAPTPIVIAKDVPDQEKNAPVATTITYEGQIDYPVSNTFHRDRVVAAAEKSLLSFDHTRATPQ